MRFLVVAIGVASLLFTVHDVFRSKRIVCSGLEWSFLLYYLCVLASFLAILWNGDALELSDYPGLAMVHLLNALAVVLIILNREFLSLRSVATILCVSGIVLAASQIAVYGGVDIGALLKSDEVRVMAEDKGQGEHLNAFGQLFRVSGFAEDPNYACLFNIIAIAMALLIRKEKPALSCVTVGLSLLGVAFAWSRTVVLGSLGIALMVVVAQRWRSPQRIYAAFLGALIPVALALPFLKIDVLQTITTRYRLWENAFDLFCQSPLLGNGLTSFRFYNSLVQNGWSVHPHSSLWETLAEFGAIAFVVLIALFALSLGKASKNPFAAFCVALTVLFSINFDCTYLQITVVALLALPLSAEGCFEAGGCGFVLRSIEGTPIKLFARQEAGKI